MKVVNENFNVNSGYHRLTLENNDTVLLTKEQYNKLESVDNINLTLHESTSGNLYVPFKTGNKIEFKNAKKLNNQL